ncbi:MAG: elongation factor P [Bacteroidetes bacterium]|nr:elongation factor P [Bacteroidota bacterium]
MASTADFRNGLVLEMNDDLWQIVEFQHVKPGKGPAFVRTKLKSIYSGKVVDNTFTSGAKITTARVESRSYQYLFKDDVGFHFMNNKTYEQIQLDEKVVTAPDFLKEGQNVEILFHAETEKPISLEMPSFVTLKITYTEPGFKGNTASNTYKPAKLETGAEVKVPLFIEEGELIKIDTRNGEYVERAK